MNDSATDPAAVLAAIQADCRALDAVGKALGAKVKALTEAEIEYQDAYDAALLDSKETSKEKREADARRGVPAELGGRVMRLRGDVEAFKRYATIKSAALSGRQSQLATLKAEMAGVP